jgi:integrase
MRDEDRHILNRAGRLYYMRRVPKRFQPYDPRTFIRSSLKTKSWEVARMRRDALEKADDDFWTTAAYSMGETDDPDARRRVRSAIDRQYAAACSRAIARGFVYAPVERLVETAELSELMDRIEAVRQVSQGTAEPVVKAEAAAMLGGVPLPQAKVSDAFERYCDEIALGDLATKSPNQKQLWLKTKRRGIQYFIDLVGDKLMREIERADGLAYRKWWAGRIAPTNGAKPVKSNTANLDIGNMRVLYSAYFSHIGEEDRPNPFRGLSFKDDAKKTRQNATPPFETKWVRDRILVPGLFDDLNEQARLIIYALIETGCRPSEIANLQPEHIRLNAEVPHIRITPTNSREIKTLSSIREIPLVGVSLDAMQQAPNGFPHYYDRNDLLSQALMKAFRARDLFPTKRHRIYSFRHAFEKRMIEAEIDTELRKILMGHADERPKYGDGGSLAFRRDQLLKIAHPYSPNVVRG